MRTAKAKGACLFYQIVFVHALKNALLPVVTVIGLMLGALLTGAVLTETLFSWPGVGRWLVASVLGTRLPSLLQGVSAVAIDYDRRGECGRRCDLHHARIRG